MDSVLDNLLFLLGQRMPRLQSSSAKPDAKLTLETAALWRQYGCGLLLSELDEEGFRDGLEQAATLYRDLLKRRSACSEFDQYYLARSKGEPLFDALAVGAWDLARDIAARMTSTWMQRMEAEEDFHYFGVLSAMLLQRPDLDSELAAFERCLQGGQSYRFDAVKGLTLADAEAFEAGLQGMIEEQAAWVERQQRSGLFDPYLHKTSAFVFIEGVALVRLARNRALKTEERYRLIPAPALGGGAG
ncbi:immunity 49 family protein [Pyxidicoccus xibeiensis]|uniref:immunity 49 family protein n=1 Tax=Pyxidicoccus xibeiensis TaxID=2906759 RepID=UPI0020A80C74|nr:immunity 49 family protein [Pyxidicoccus xibeiensis]MCP3143932.1 immunity 49 family protein [Pyxidicoccus xibeiensis]